ncbi:MAG TPA: tripartite tricarboxylate transporter TctB family protein [Candidatus Methylomirabilis sp.]|nr:tripartite tricarboxylate transporter TctB family protein [Candidatus Methylomirabilis sp.]
MTAFRALTVASLFFCLLTGAYLVDGLKLPLGSAGRPGAGAYPLLVGLLLAMLSLSLLFKSVTGWGSADEEPLPRGTDMRRVAAVSTSLVLFVLLLRPLGYTLSSALLMAAILRLLEQRNWKAIVLISVASATLSHLLFARLLGVPLPVGMIFD